MIYADSESILVQEDNKKQNPDEPYMRKYQNHVACSYGHKLVRVDDRFRTPFTSYLGEDVVYDFINGMLEESKYCSDVGKKQFNKELVMTKKDDEDF